MSVQRDELVPDLMAVSATRVEKYNQRNMKFTRKVGKLPESI